jgi:hypothetical protein
MSLLDLLAAAGEELVGLRVLAAGSRSEAEIATARKVSGRFRWLTSLGLISGVACWVLARILPPSRLASLAALGVYVSLVGTLFCALGWAYARTALLQGTRRRGRDA